MKRLQFVRLVMITSLAATMAAVLSPSSGSAVGQAPVISGDGSLLAYDSGPPDRINGPQDVYLWECTSTE